MKKIMVFGTFDGVHPGHLNFFAQAREYGDYLLVVIARDVNVKEIKGRYPEQSEKQRQKAVQKVPGVDKAILGYKANRLKIIKEYRPDIICLGYDQEPTVAELGRQLKNFGLTPEIKKLKAYQPEKYKSSIIKQSRI